MFSLLSPIYRKLPFWQVQAPAMQSYYCLQNASVKEPSGSLTFIYVLAEDRHADSLPIRKTCISLVDSPLSVSCLAHEFFLRDILSCC